MEMRSYKKSKIADATSMEIKYILDEIIDRTGKINNIELKLPATYLGDILKTLDRDLSRFLHFTLKYDGEIIILKIGDDN